MAELTSRYFEVGSTLPAGMHEGVVVGVFPTSDAHPTVKFILRVNVPVQSAYAPKGKMAKYQLVIDVLADRDDDDESLAEEDHKWLQKVAVAHTASVELGGLRVTRVDFTESRRVYVEAAGPRKISVRGQERVLRQRKSVDHAEEWFYTPSPVPRAGSAASHKSPSPTLPPLRRPEPSKAVPLAQKRSREPRPLSTHALDPRLVGPSLKRRAEGERAGQDKRVRISATTQDALPAAGPSTAGPSTAVPAPAMDVPSASARLAAAHAAPRAAPRWVTAPPSHPAPPPSRRTLVNLSSQAEVGAAPPPAETPVRPLLPTPSTALSSRIESIETPFTTQEGGGDGDSVPASSAPAPPPAPDSSPAHGAWLDRHSSPASHLLPAQHSSPSKSESPSRPDERGKERGGTPLDVMRSRSALDRQHRMDRAMELLRAKKEASAQSSPSAEPSPSRPSHLPSDTAKASTTTPATTSSTNERRQAQKERMEREKAEYEERKRLRAKSERAERERLQRAAETRRLEEEQKRQRAEQEARERAEAQQRAREEAERAKAKREKEAAEAARVAREEEARRARAAAVTKATKMEAQPAPPAAAGGPMDARRAAEERARLANEARAAAETAEREQRIAEAASLTAPLMVGKYVPLANMDVGPGRNVMGVIIKVDAIKPPRKGQHSSLTIVIADPSTHTDGAASDDRQVTVFHDKAVLAEAPFAVGNPVLFRNLTSSMWNDRPKGNLFPSPISEWYILKGGSCNHGGNGHGRSLSTSEVDRLKALAAWWRTQGEDGGDRRLSGGKSGAQPSGRKDATLGEVVSGIFFNLTAKVLHVEDKQYISRDSPAYEIYLTDGTVNSRPTRNYHNVTAGVDPRAIMCLNIYNDDDGDTMLYKEGTVLRFENVRVHEYGGLLELKWSNLLTDEQQEQKWRQRRVTLVPPEDERAVEIERRVADLKRLHAAGAQAPTAAAPVPEAPSPARTPPPPPVHGVSRDLATVHRDPVRHPPSTIAQVLANRTAPNRFRVLARVAQIIPRDAKGSRPGDLAVMWCRKCCNSFADSHCMSCNDTTFKEAELRYQMVLVLEPNTPASASDDDRLAVVFDGDEAAAVLDPLPLVHSGPNEVKRLRARISSFTPNVENILLGNRFDGERSRPLIDWSIETYAGGPKNSLDYLLMRVFGMKKGAE